MAKIIKTNLENTTISLDSGELFNISTDKLNFEPCEGDIVEIFKSGSEIIVKKSFKDIKESKNDYYEKIENENSKKDNKVLVNKLTYCLLAFFLGGFGIHKFYAKKTVLGIIYIVFSWTGLTGIAALIEFVIAICKKADENGNIYV